MKARRIFATEPSKLGILFLCCIFLSILVFVGCESMQPGNDVPSATIPTTASSTETVPNTEAIEHPTESTGILPLTEEQILKDVADKVNSLDITVVDELSCEVYYSATVQMDVTDVRIERRKIDEKQDTSYCVVSMENEDYRCTQYVKVEYNYYDVGGWFMDTCESYELPECDSLSTDTLVQVTMARFALEYPELTDYALDDILSAKMDDGSANEVNVLIGANRNEKHYSMHYTVGYCYYFKNGIWSCYASSATPTVTWNIEGEWGSTRDGSTYHLSIDQLDVNNNTVTGMFYVERYDKFTRRTYTHGWDLSRAQITQDENKYGPELYIEIRFNKEYVDWLQIYVNKTNLQVSYSFNDRDISQSSIGLGRLE